MILATPSPQVCASPSFMHPGFSSPSSPTKSIGHTPSTAVTGFVATESYASFASFSPRRSVQSPSTLCATPQRPMRLTSAPAMPSALTQPTAERKPTLSVGQKVRIVGMVSQYQRNWEDGVLEEWHANLGAKGQWRVQLSNANVLLPEEDLEVISGTNLGRRAAVHRALEEGWTKASETQRLSWLKEFASVSHRGLLERSVASEQFESDGSYTQSIEWYPFSEDDWRKLAADGCAWDTNRSVLQSLDTRLPGGHGRRVDTWMPGRVAEPKAGELRWPCCDHQRRRKQPRTLREALDMPPCRHSE